MSRLRLGNWLLPYRWFIAAGMALLLATNLVQIAIPWAVQRALDAFTVGHGLGEAREFSLFVIGFAALRATLSVAAPTLIFRAAFGIERDLRRDVHSKLLGLSTSFFAQHRLGDLLSRLVNDVSATRYMFAFGLVNIVNTAFTYALTLWRIFEIDRRLSLYSLIPFVGLVFVGRVFSRALFGRSRAVSETQGSMTATVHEDLSGITTVKHYVLEDVRGSNFRRMCREFVKQNLLLFWSDGWMTSASGLLAALGSLAVLWFGGRAVMEGRLTIGGFAAFNMYLLQLVWPTLALGVVLSSWQRGLAAWARITEILATVPTLNDGPMRNVSSADLQGDIEVRNLTIIRDGRVVLENISFRVPAGSVAAIVGPIGAGKSTLLDVLARLTEVPDGALFIGGHDVNQLPLAVVRGAIGYAPQPAFLFAGSIRDNIVAGSPTGEADVENLCAAAGLQRDIAAWPLRLDTVVGERGVTLSGGQRQRVALARTLATGSSIVILDDPLAAVDGETERVILTAIRARLKGRTTIVSSHRALAVREADTILVLEGGRLSDSGTHADLMSRSGYYATAFRRQALEQEIEIANSAVGERRKA